MTGGFLASLTFIYKNSMLSMFFNDPDAAGEEEENKLLLDAKRN